jgi:small subunit ribosomal protein S6
VNSYETVVVFDGSLPEDTLHKEQETIASLLRDNAEPANIDVWGKRDLAYDIDGKKIGHYCLFQYRGEGELIARLDRELKMNEKVLRHLTVRSKPYVAPEAPREEPEEGQRAEEAASAESETTEDAQ